MNKETPPGTLRELQQALMDLQRRGLGKAKSAALDALRENLIEALRLGFNRQEIWEALRQVGYEGSYRHFGTKLHRLGIKRSRVTSAAPFARTIVSGSGRTTDASTAVTEKEEPSLATWPNPHRSTKSKRNGDGWRKPGVEGEIYRKPKPQPKKHFVFNPED